MVYGEPTKTVWVRLGPISASVPADSTAPLQTEAGASVALADINEAAVRAAAEQLVQTETEFCPRVHEATS